MYSPAMPPRGPFRRDGCSGRNTDVSWSLLNTSIFIAIVPTLVLVVLVWKFVVEDLLSGSVKG